MELCKEILAIVIVAIILSACSFLLPIVLITALTLEGILVTYIYLTALLQFAFQATLSRSIHWVIVPAILLGLTVIHWIKSRRIDIVNVTLLCWTKFGATLNTMWTVTMEYGLLPLVIEKVSPVWELIRDYNMSFARVVVEDTIEESGTVVGIARVRTKEQDRLRRLMDNLEALETDVLVSMEHAILLALTRTAAADSHGLVYYRLSEDHGPSGPDQLPQQHQYETMRPHTHYYKLYESNCNLVRHDEPDCAICYSPLEVGEEMVTHETCRRTFHTACFDVALLRERICPFDREDLVARPNELGRAPIVNPTVNVVAEQEQFMIDLDRDQLVWDLAMQQVRGARRRRVLGENPAAPNFWVDLNEHMEENQRRGLQQLQEAEDGLPRQPGKRQERRPANRPHRGNVRGRGTPRRAWR